MVGEFRESLTLSWVWGGDELSGGGILEAALSLFLLGEESPSEMSLGGGTTKKEETNIVNNKISDCKEGSDKATMFQSLACVVMDL